MTKNEKLEAQQDAAIESAEGMTFQGIGIRKDVTRLTAKDYSRLAMERKARDYQKALDAYKAKAAEINATIDALKAELEDYGRTLDDTKLAFQLARDEHSTYYRD